MDRAERIGLGVAIVAHAALFAALSFGLLTRPAEAPVRDAVSVTLTDEIGLESASPEPEAASAPRAPEDGPPEPAPMPEPELTPAPRVEPTPPPPRPRATPQRREPPPRSRPEPRREATPRERPSERPAERPSGSRISNITEGIGTNPSRSSSRASSAAAVTGAQRAAYTALIAARIQPCLNRQSPPGPGAERIRTSLTLRFNPDGSLSGRPSIRRQSGVDDSNSRYSDRVGEQSIASVMACSPIRGLPADLYRTQNGQGWNSVDVAITIEAN